VTVPLERLADFAAFAISALTERKVRSALTIAGIAIGPLALVAILGVVEGYSGYVINQLQGLGQNLIVLIPGADYRLTQSDLNFLKRLDGVEEVTPFYSIRAEARRGGEKIQVTVYAVDIDTFFKALNKLRIEFGEKPSPAEATSAVVGRFIAFDEEGRQYYSVGDVITISYYEIKSGRPVLRRVNVRIKGVLAEFGNAFFVNPDETVFLPLEAGRKLLGFKDWSGIMVIARGPEHVERITRYLRTIYGERVSVVSLVEISRIVASISAAMRFVTVAAGSAAFAVAVTGVAATMITSVMERTREIGVMKAIGFTNRDVILMILLESAIMGVLGAIVGSAAGVVAAYALSGKGMVIQGVHTIVIKAKPAITAGLLARTFLMTLLVSMAGGSLPAYQAARIPPAVALRYE
jgi:putative ABC transport system permease protein